MEQALLNDIMEEKGDEITDLILRAWGILTNAHMLSAVETVKLLSQVKLGVNLGIITLKNPKILNELLITSQPAHLMELSAKDLNQKQRDIYRAKIVKQQLNKEIL